MWPPLLYTAPPAITTCRAPTGANGDNANSMPQSGLGRGFAKAAAADPLTAMSMQKVESVASVAGTRGSLNRVGARTSTVTRGEREGGRRDVNSVEGGHSLAGEGVD